MNLDLLAQEWCALERQSVNHSFFLSWHWIGSWLRSLPERIRPQLLRIRSGDRTLGLGVIVCGRSPVLRFFHLHQIALNATGDTALDGIAIEYNGFLAAGGYETDVTRSGLEWLLQGGLSNQSLFLAGIDSPMADAAIALAHENGRMAAWLNLAPAPYVDLARIRKSTGDYLSFLSRNTRQMMRRSLRHYENIGQLRYHCADSVDEALHLLKELEQAHQVYWHSRGRPGAFAEPYFRCFHEELIRSAFADGHIEIAQVRAGDVILGYLYNFLWRGTVYAYQSGFNYGEDSLARPGYVSHFMAIISALEQGYNVYDFMAGIRQHKTSLSTAHQDLAWLRFSAPVPTVRLESVIKIIVAKLRGQNWRAPV